MRRALELAELGRGHVSPNPIVGCVIVHDSKIIGEGYHQKYGEAHAEVNAIKSVTKQDLLSQSTAYVTLEPCAHFGKTPPCADLLIEKKVKKVVVACRDPFDQVNGKGIEKLEKAGVEVELGVLEKEAQELNSRFFTFHQQKRPYVILKWAQTEDGFIARENYDSKWISNPYSRQLVHKWRTEEDAILVGKNTATHDNPFLTTRDWSGRNPKRVLLDSRLEVPLDYNIYNKEIDTIIINTEKDDLEGKNRWIKVDEINPEIVMETLHNQNIQSVIIEGGSKVLNSFMDSNCWDEARVFTSKQNFGSGITAPKMSIEPSSKENIKEDELRIYKND